MNKRKEMRICVCVCVCECGREREREHINLVNFSVPDLLAQYAVVVHASPSPQEGDERREWRREKRGEKE